MTIFPVNFTTNYPKISLNIRFLLNNITKRKIILLQAMAFTRRIVLFVTVITATIDIVFSAKQTDVSKIEHCYPEKKGFFTFNPIITKKIDDGTVLMDIIFDNPIMPLGNNTYVLFEMARQNKNGEFQILFKQTEPAGVCQALNKYLRTISIKLQAALGFPNPGKCPFPKGKFFVKDHSVSVNDFHLPLAAPSGTFRSRIEIREKGTDRLGDCIILDTIIL